MIKPSYSHTTLVFNCPNCNQEYSFLSYELKDKPIDFYCGCGQEFIIPRIFSLKVKISNKKFVPQNIKDSAKIVGGMGWNRKKIGQICRKNLKKWRNLTVEDIIRELVLEASND